MSVEITRLNNGIHVITHHMPHLETAALGIWVKAGARDERAEENGVAHFLEHMAFKGTPRRSARAIAEEIESAGGEINAATGMETTTYYARVLKQDWALALDILADIFTSPELDEEELERERDVILQEIAAAHDQPDDLVFDLFNDAAYPHQPIGRPILGTPERVASFDAPALRAYLGQHYGTPNAVVAASGALEHQRRGGRGQPRGGEAPGARGGRRRALRRGVGLPDPDAAAAAAEAAAASRASCR